MKKSFINSSNNGSNNIDDHKYSLIFWVLIFYHSFKYPELI
jgi:hypothetical protein